MTEQTIIERTGIEDRNLAEDLKVVLELAGWTCEIVEEADGTFTLRAYPPGFGPVEPAMNAADTSTEIEGGPPETEESAGIKTLLDFIARFESGGNYNAYFRHANNQNDPKFTSMLLSSVVDWQKNHTQVNGNPSSAVGRYQIIRKTLNGLINSLGVDPGAERFSQETQDRMAIKLLEQRGLAKFQSGALSVEDFGNKVAMEWASMPVLKAVKRGNVLVQPGSSYYSGDGLNKAHAGIESFRKALLAAK